MRSCWFVAVFFATLVVCSCSSKPRYVKDDPFLTSESEFKHGVRIMSVAPVLIPEGLPDATPVVDEFSGLIDEELKRYGFSVMRPQQYEKTWKAVAGEPGDFVDAKTGERDEAAMSRAMSLTLDRLGADFKIEGVLFPSIAVVEADFAAGTAAWDGVEQRIESGGAVTRFLAGSQRGVVGALSLKVSIRSAEGKLLFENSGGIEVLSRMVGKEFVTVPRQELFADAERNRKAVRTALEPLKR
jgi:hypothetical protein